MRTNPDEFIARIAESLAARPGVRGVALVGSRASGDPSRVDAYSDADFLVCCVEKERGLLLDGCWIAPVEAPLLVFPRVVEDEARVLFRDLFACEFHFLTVAEAERASGPCTLGTHLSTGFAILHDPDGLMARLAAKIRPEPPDARDPAAASSVFWYNIAYCANLILRGDLFRASHIANWYLQLFLIDLIYSIEEPDATKYIARKLEPEQYEAVATTIAPLTREGMVTGLRNCMGCYWRLQAIHAPEIDAALLDSFREIEREVLRRFEAMAERQSEPR